MSVGCPKCIHMCYKLPVVEQWLIMYLVTSVCLCVISSCKQRYLMNYFVDLCTIYNRHKLHAYHPGNDNFFDTDNNLIWQLSATVVFHIIGLQCPSHIDPHCETAGFVSD